MKFKLTITNNVFLEKYHIEEIENYKKLGFVFEEAREDFVVTKNEVEIELDIEGLVNLSKEFDELIISGNKLEIYNARRE